MGKGVETPPCMWTLVHSPLMMRTRNMSTGQFPAAAGDSLSSEVFSSPLQTQKRPQEKSAALERGLVGHKEHQQSGEAPGKLAPAAPLPHSHFTRKGFRIPRTRKGLNRGPRKLKVHGSETPELSTFTKRSDEGLK